MSGDGDQNLVYQTRGFREFFVATRVQNVLCRVKMCYYEDKWECYKIVARPAMVYTYECECRVK